MSKQNEIHLCAYNPERGPNPTNDFNDTNYRHSFHTKRLYHLEPIPVLVLYMTWVDKMEQAVVMPVSMYLKHHGLKIRGHLNV